MRSGRSGRAFAFLLLPALVAMLAACGSSKKSSSSSSSSSVAQGGTLALSISDTAQSARFTAPSSAQGGRVNVVLKNLGKAPHSAQLVLIKGHHTLAQALRVVQGRGNKTPSWLRAEGGVGQTMPGQTATVVVNLPPGHYGLTELGGPGGGGPPAAAELQVSSGPPGSLPKTATKVTAATAGKDRYKWQISGALRTGTNRITFASKGKDALHLIDAVRLNGNPSKAQIIKALRSRGRPAPILDVTSFTQSAVLDGGKSDVTDLTLARPGRYALFCLLSDRDGGKPHYAEGLLRTVSVP